MFIQSRKMTKRRATIGVPLCLFNRHRPDRRAAKWDGTQYVSYCKDCSRHIRRKARNDWRRAPAKA